MAKNVKHYDQFDELIADLRKKKRQVHLLLGNGFSMAYDSKIFSYNALATFVEEVGDSTLTKLFAVLKTKNFEVIMEQLTTFAALLKKLDADPKLQAKVATAHEKLKTSLLDAVKSLHPDHVFKIPEERLQACVQFLSKVLDTGGCIYSTNYDLLLYWVLLRGKVGNAGDGFGRELENQMEVVNDGAEPELSDLRWGPNVSTQNVFHLHGTLPIFDTGTEIVKETYDGENWLLENISSRFDLGEYPVFVAAGSGNDKLAQIRGNRYLTHCYDRLSKIDGSLISFGFAFGASDSHIVRALNKACNLQSDAPPKLRSIYIGVYSKADAAHIRSIASKFHTKVYTFDAGSANVWDSA